LATRDSSEWVVMGRVLAPWGVKGALKIEPFGAESGNLC
jgi:ribosomal 30S subunit maturation factor RimM